MTFGKKDYSSPEKKSLLDGCWELDESRSVGEISVVSAELKIGEINLVGGRRFPKKKEGPLDHSRDRRSSRQFEEIRGRRGRGCFLLLSRLASLRLRARPQHCKTLANV